MLENIKVRPKGMSLKLIGMEHLRVSSLRRDNNGDGTNKQTKWNKQTYENSIKQSERVDSKNSPRARVLHPQ